MALPVNWKILLIDDDEDIRDIMSITLKDAGYSVICAPDGHTGLMLAAREEPQIVITDIKMPGMSGLEVLEKIKKIKPETEVIVTTGFGDIKKAVKALQYDASDFISKPVDDAALHMALKRARQRYIDKKQLSDYTALLERDLKTMEQEVSNQAKLLHREKMVSLGRLAASMVHEINNPLSGILNYIRLMIRISGKDNNLKSNLTLEKRQDQANKFNSYLEIIESETQRCSDLVSGLLKFSRKTNLEQKSIDVTDLIQHSLLLCNHKLELSNIVLNVRCNPDVLPVFGDFNQLEQCIINLIFNAIDAMENGGNLKIETGFNPEEKHVFISIKDNGKGISKEDLNFIFEPFFTTKSEGYGVGLGLSSAYGIVEKHKGTIVVESRLDHGSEFIIKLPPEKKEF
ncbi:hybrid sensor histidine kinase/response regulator [Desulfobacula sp.]|uniref:hybrid sensor histidine kinase/response regulator n=1 Tax=Desulfobacula sp. TaxID=2593537 RepID=UPI0025C54375|nr:hybrid sensor histidine kinase/response regulator [Desulfobacula sp.]MBC2703321.1 hybrid sensor histidine kinase/response regulator [Desulfobacula sp.]